MKTLIDFDEARAFAIPTVSWFHGETMHAGVLIEGPQGWGEFSPPPDCDDQTATRWLTAAIEPGTVGWPDPVRGRVPVSVRVPAVDPARAYEIVAESGCRAADVTVAAGPDALAEDAVRLQAVRDALGPDGALRCDAHGRWDVETAVSAITVLDKAAEGLEYVEQPCHTVEELASVRRKVDVRIAADESVRLADNAHSLRNAVDVAVLTCAPLGGVRRALRFAALCGAPCVVSSAVETSIGLSAGLALAGALPELPFSCGLGTRRLLTGDLVAAPRSLDPVDGYLPVAPMPPAPDPELLGRYAVTDEDRVTGWRDLLGRARREL